MIKNNILDLEMGPWTRPLTLDNPIKKILGLQEGYGNYFEDFHTRHEFRGHDMVQQ